MTKIVIHQGNDLHLPYADVNVVIDVIRAFTVTHYAFMRGADKILLVSSVDEAFRLKQKLPSVLLAGEVDGLPVEGFDLDNSPVTVSSANIFGKTLIQKTTNGVKATLNSLDASTVLVTGFSNADATVTYIQRLMDESEIAHINLIASHPSSDEDMVCAEYIRDRLQNKACSMEQVQKRICSSDAAKKFFDPMQTKFDVKDIDYCLKTLQPKFVMRVVNEEIPVIQREEI